MVSCQIRLFETQIRTAYPNLPEKEYEKYKDRDFAGWIKFYVNNGYGNESFPLWFHELAQGPISKIVTAPMYFTRGYAFHSRHHGSRRATANYGIYVRGETNFYGVIDEILEVSYAGLLNLRIVLFKCEWYDPTIGRGMRVNSLGVTDVNATRRYSKFEPYVLASQAEQVTFIPYPRIRERRTDQWLSVVHISPRGRIVGAEEDLVLQEDTTGVDTSTPVESTEDVIHVDPNFLELEDTEGIENEEQVQDENEDEEEIDTESGDDEQEESVYVSDNESE